MSEKRRRCSKRKVVFVSSLQEKVNTSQQLLGQDEIFVANRRMCMHHLALHCSK